MSQIRQSVSEWGHTVIDLIERAYRIVRGLPHNRNTAIVVVAGVAILAGPLWEPYLRALFEKLAGVQVALPTEPIYGLAVIAIGLFYHVAMTWLALKDSDVKAKRETQSLERIRKHDKPIFENFIGEAPENRFTSALNCLRDDHACSGDQYSMQSNAYYFLDTVSNEFNDKLVQSKADALRKALDELNGFTAQHFYIIHQAAGGQTRHALEPNWNWDRGGNPTFDQERRYSELGSKLSKLVGAATHAYQDFLRTSQRRLL